MDENRVQSTAHARMSDHKRLEKEERRKSGFTLKQMAIFLLKDFHVEVSICTLLDSGR
jgi:hypothetical protein